MKTIAVRKSCAWRVDAREGLGQVGDDPAGARLTSIRPITGAKVGKASSASSADTIVPSNRRRSGGTTGTSRIASAGGARRSRLRRWAASGERQPSSRAPRRARGPGPAIPRGEAPRPHADADHAVHGRRAHRGREARRPARQHLPPGRLGQLVCEEGVPVGEPSSWPSAACHPSRGMPRQGAGRGTSCARYPRARASPRRRVHGGRAPRPPSARDW